LRTTKASDIIEVCLRDANKTLAEVVQAEVIMFRSPLMLGVDDAVRECIESLIEHAASSVTKQNRLCVVIETTGGYIEVVERIYSVFRKYYEEVVFVIPSFAYSAGTVLVLSGDEIYMDYYSVLGPIDPQIDGEDGNGSVPGIGYLVKFNQLMKRINDDPDGLRTRAEMAYLVSKFDPAKLFFIEQAKDHAIELLKQWLPRHKFKDWDTTETGKTPVNENMKESRANNIAEVLGNPERWHSHGRGIGIRELGSDEIKLKIKNFGDDSKLNEAVRQYYDLVIDYFAKMGTQYGIHSQHGVRRL
jgi:membrane-bound ClpP family serine protease